MEVQFHEFVTKKLNEKNLSVSWPCGIIQEDGSHVTESYKTEAGYAQRPF